MNVISSVTKERAYLSGDKRKVLLFFFFPQDFKISWSPFRNTTEKKYLKIYQENICKEKSTDAVWQQGHAGRCRGSWPHDGSIGMSGSRACSQGRGGGETSGMLKNPKTSIKACPGFCSPWSCFSPSAVLPPAKWHCVPCPRGTRPHLPPSGHPGGSWDPACPVHSRCSAAPSLPRKALLSPELSYAGDWGIYWNFTSQDQTS